MKYVIMLVALIFFGVLFFIIKSESDQENIKNSNTVKKNKLLHKCNLSNEIIDRQNIDTEINETKINNILETINR